ncbi:MAG: 2-oxoacid:ferredoxin oxidoreductase subunit beta [Hyphomicrobiaceae bacterium]|nr:2-oxoacid:ferredoxin oxidoreductase subunit beta [Hyphomicrobiaceae bacterium]
MTYMKKPLVKHPDLPKNELGLTRRDYEGLVSTLCAGCGHDSISAAIIEACFELDLPAHRLAKLSGIGCSSKTPTYFLNRSHGFNSVHGRMPSIATGANLANRDLIYLGVSGDGDTASIGLGQFCHAMRRRINMAYIVENNGTYGLTKGQFSATNDKVSKSKKGEANLFEAFDLCTLAIQLGAGFVGRSFSGDKGQLVPLIKAALRYNGFAFLDIISPCVTFNDHDASTKSYGHVRTHNETMGRLDFVPKMQEITAQYDEGETVSVPMHDGSLMRLHKLDDEYDPRDADSALATLRKRYERGQVVTGLLYIDEDEADLHALLNTTQEPLNAVSMDKLCPGNAVLQKINKSFR